MSEATKTVSMVVAAVVVLLAAWLSIPTLPIKGPDEIVGSKLFSTFDPKEAASLEIVEYDEATGTPKPFQVAKQKNVWCIPSHENYPADAKDQMAEAATSVMDLKVLRVAGMSPGEHEAFGVVDPDKAQAGAKGVGTRVVLKDAGGKPLVSLIIGKTVEGKSDQHYVRKIGEDPIYAVNVKTYKISSKFDEWIEKDLLKMPSLDFKDVSIADYSMDIRAQGFMLRARPVERGRLGLRYDDAADPKWKLLEDMAVQNNKPVNLKLAPDEELDTAKLDTLKSSITDLKIVDVRRKPEGLSAGLKGGSLKIDEEAMQSLAERGFYLLQSGGSAGLYSSEGEVACTMKNGVEYVLRFGGLADSTAAKKDKKDDKAKDDKSKDDKAKTDKDGKPEEKKDAARNRYIFVMAQFNSDAIAKPQLEPLPEEKKAEEKKPDDKKADGKKADEKKPEDKKVDEKKADEKKAEDKKPDDKKADEKKADDKKPEDEKKQPTKAELKAERERIEKENKRKQEEYDAAVKKAQDQVKELNERFGDWYYVISDEVYQKIHLNRAAIVKKKEKKDDKAKDASKPGDAHDHDHDHDHDKADAKDGNLPMDFDKLQKDLPGKKE